jgi:nucleotide-binding universal stress UspA family protein
MSQRPCLIAAVDLNNQAAGVLRRATKLAAMCHADLVVTHVVDYRGVFESDHVPVRSPAEVQGSLTRQARAWLLGLLHHLDAAGPGVEIRVSAGQPLGEIADLATERGARFIVMGRQAWGRRFGALAGLAQDPRIQALNCDVITVEGRDGGTLASDFGNTIRRRLFTVVPGGRTDS